MPSFFTRASPPRLVNKTSDRFFQDGTAGHQFLQGLLAPLDAHGKHMLETEARSFPKTDAEDPAAREALQKSYYHLLQMRQHASSRSGAVATSTTQIADTIVRMVGAIRKKFLAPMKDRGTLVQYEIRDGFVPFDRALLPCCFPFMCIGGGDPTDALLKDYQHAASWEMQYVKRFLILAVSVCFVCSMLCLSYAQLALYICYAGTQPMPFIATDGVTHQPMTCGDLVDHCGIPEFGYMKISTYYSVRILSYLCSLMPFMLLAASPIVISMKLLHPLVDIESPHGEHATAAGVHQRHAGSHSTSDLLAQECPVCNPTNYDASQIFSMASTLIFFTHCVFGGFTLALDASLANYIQKLPGECYSSPNVTIGLTNSDCGCAALFSTSDARGFVRVSAMQIMSPYGIAVFLAVQNAFYTIWGLVFVVQTCTFGVVDRAYDRHADPSEHAPRTHSVSSSHPAEEDDDNDDSLASQHQHAAPRMPRQPAPHLGAEPTGHGGHHRGIIPPLPHGLGRGGPH